MSRNRVRDNVFSLLLGLATLALYLPIAPVTVLEADPGEFQFAAPLAGIAHPTGYPVYLVLGWLWTHLLPLEAAHEMNLLSGVFSAMAVALVSKLVLVLAGKTPAWSAWPAAAMAAMAFAVAPTVWSQSIVAEVYPLAAALLALLLLVTIKYGDNPKRWWVIAAVVGLCSSHHLTSALYFPFVLAAVAILRRHPVRWRHLRRALVAFIAPLLSYAYIPLRASHTPYLYQYLGAGETLSLYDNSLPGFLAFVTGQVFGSSLTAQGAAQRAATALHLSRVNLPILIWLLAIAGAAALLRSQRGAFTVIVGGLAANIGFNLIYAIGDIHVFYIPPYMLIAVLAGVAIAKAETMKSGAFLSPVLALISLLMIGSKVGAAKTQALASIPAPPEERWEQLFQAAPASAVLVSNDRNEIMPMWYHQYVEGKRNDLTGLFPLIVPGPDYDDVGAVVQQALATGRPVCLIKEMPGLEIAFALTPEAPLVRVRGTWRTTPSIPSSSALANKVALEGYDLSAQTIAPGQELVITLYWLPLASLKQPYSTYVHVVDESGQSPWPGSDHRPGGVYYPATLWQPGQQIRDEHVIPVPDGAAPGTYRLIAGMYVYPSLESLGEAVTLGTFTVSAPR